MANEQNLKPFTKNNAKEMGRRGGIASGKTRLKKALTNQYINSFIEISNYINNMDDLEYKEFLNDFTVDQQEEIRKTFKSTQRELKKMCKQY